jgi:PEGA domain
MTRTLFSSTVALTAFLTGSLPALADEHGQHRGGFFSEARDRAVERGQHVEQHPVTPAPQAVAVPRATPAAPRVMPPAPQATAAPRVIPPAPQVMATPRVMPTAPRVIPAPAPRVVSAPTPGFDRDRRDWDRRDGDRRDWERRDGDRRDWDRHDWDRDRFGYRPYVFRPRWQISFGIFAGYPVPYTYADPYPVPVYGYAAPASPVVVGPESNVYGGVTLEITPNDGSVYVDGAYAGIVRDFDGSRQAMTLAGGEHQIEIDRPGYEPLVMDVNVQPGQVVPYRGEMQPAQ